MATKTCGELKLALASLWGFEAIADLLDQDARDLLTYLNAAYFDCFAPVDSTRPNYSEEHIARLLKAPVTASLDLTQGSTLVAGYAFEDAYTGSFVKIGDHYYRSADATHLVEPWDGATDTYTATVYHNAVKLPVNVIEVAGLPSIIGLGTLSPLPDPDFEIKLRSEPAPDFQSRSGREPFAVRRSRFNPSLYYDTGDPCYYYVDSASVAPSFALGDRFHVYPVPDRALTVTFRANAIPVALEDDADVPQMPALAVDNILLPIAREKLAENTAGRRFTGNVPLIMAAAERARAQLKTLSRKQRHTAGGFRVRRGW